MSLSKGNAGVGEYFANSSVEGVGAYEKAGPLALLPTRSAMGVNGLALGARVEMECWAWGPGA